MDAKLRTVLLFFCTHVSASVSPHCDLIDHDITSLPASSLSFAALFSTSVLLSPILFHFCGFSRLLNPPFDAVGAPLSSPLYLFLPNADISDLKSRNDSLVGQNLFSSATLLHTSLVCDTCPSVRSLPPPPPPPFSVFYTLFTHLCNLSLSDPISPSVLQLSLATLHREPP